MWQALHGDVQDLGFTVIALALDTADAARPWIEKVAPDYPALIDAEHRTAALFNFRNVPEAVWIDETGRIVRPTETAGAYEAFRCRNLETGETPADELQKQKDMQRRYFEAARDWARTGDASSFVMSAEDARAHIARPTAAEAEAHARFRLGAWLAAHGRAVEAEAQMAEASRLHPDSWAIWRQGAERNEQGYAAGPEFWARVQALGDRRYYPPPPMAGMN